MGVSVKADQSELTCDDVRRLLDDYLSGSLAADEIAAVEDHCSHCETCRALISDAVEAQLARKASRPPAPPPYLAAEIKSEAKQLRSPERIASRKRMVGSPHFLAACAVIVVGAMATLVATYHLNSLKPRQDAWVPAFVVTSGGGVIFLADPENPMREQTPDEVLEKLNRGREALRKAQGPTTGPGAHSGAADGVERDVSHQLGPERAAPHAGNN